MPLSLQYIAPALLPSPFCTVLIVFPILESFTCCCALIRVWSIVQIAWMRNLSMASMIQLARAPCLPALVICSAGIQRPFQMSHLAQMTATHARCAVIGRSNWRLFMCVLLCMCAAVHVCCCTCMLLICSLASWILQLCQHFFNFLKRKFISWGVYVGLK